MTNNEFKITEDVILTYDLFLLLPFPQKGICKVPPDSCRKFIYSIYKCLNFKNIPVRVFEVPVNNLNNKTNKGLKEKMGNKCF